LSGDIEARNGQQSGCGDGFDVVHDASQMIKDAIVKPILQNSNESFVVCLCVLEISIDLKEIE
jgi:hypothetical protein